LIVLKIGKTGTVDHLWRLLTQAAAEFEIDRMELSLNGAQDSVLRWENGENHDDATDGKSREWRSQKFELGRKLARLTLGYYRSLDEDLEVERSYRLEVISQAAEKALSKVLQMSAV
jgi:hypothetical protein